MPCNLVKLVDVEEMNYLAAKGEGEVSGIHQSFTLVVISSNSCHGKDSAISQHSVM